MRDYLNLLFVFNSWLLTTITDQAAIAQINVDSSLPNPSSASHQNQLIIIDGGTQNGSNLFHSFQEFSVPTNKTVLFNNNLEIRNIFSRITGNSISVIDGIIQANGQANLFLLNPNGLIFGPNARLNLGGSFYGTTANQIIFEDGTYFQAKEANASTLLTMSRPIGLSFDNPGEISVQGLGNTLQLFGLIPIQRLSNSMGLSVKPEQTLALLGGKIRLEGGILQTDGGHIEIGSIESGQIRFNSVSNNQLFDYSAVSEFDNILLSDQSLVEVRGIQGFGVIGLQGKNISILESSTILSQNFLQPAKLIRIEATDTITIKGVIRDSAITSSGIRSEALGSGQGADIRLKSETLLLDSGGQITTQTFKDANAGNIFVNSNLIRVNGAVSNIITLLSSSTFGKGDAGDLDIQARQLEILRGANLISASFNMGKAGDINLIITDYIQLEGFDPLFLSPSIIGSSTLGSGNAGNVTINTAKLTLERGGTIETNTISDGQAGNIFINASELVKVDGSIPKSIGVSQITSGANIIDESFQELISFLVEVPDVLTGDSGNITINTPNLLVTNEGRVAVKNDGLGRAGNINIHGDSVFVTNFGEITAASQADDGGNINLRVNSLDLNSHGNISVQAENLGNGGIINIDAERISLNNGSSLTATTESENGGNINIRANFFFSENSIISARSTGSGNGGNINFTVGKGIILFGENEIIAEAVEGNGGNISITTPVFLPSASTRISASSSFGLDGNIDIQTPDNNLLSAIIPIKAQILEVDESITQNCSPQNQNRFVITSNQSLPPTPENMPGRIIEYYPGQPENESKLPIPPNAVIKTEEGKILVVNLCLKRKARTN